MVWCKVWESSFPIRKFFFSWHKLLETLFFSLLKYHETSLESQLDIYPYILGSNSVFCSTNLSFHTEILDCFITIAYESHGKVV